MSEPRPERWLVLRVRRTGGEDAEALLCEALLGLGGRAVLEEAEHLVTHVPEPRDLEAFLGRTRDRLREALGSTASDLPEIETELQDHRDWAEIWKAGLAPRRVGERLVVTPSWCAFEPAPEELVVTLDPGMAFGTAEHGTTRGCLRLLERAVREGEHVLDVGSGSGILSIAAALLGARRVLALEMDAWAVPICSDNVERNGVGDRVDVREIEVGPAVLAELGRVDGVAANLETGIHRRLLPGYAEALGPDGWMILGGVPVGEWDPLASDVGGAGFRLEETALDGEWCSGHFRRSVPDPATGGSAV